MAGDVAFIAAKTIGLSRVFGRKPCDLITAARHNLREIQAELGAVGRIDARRTGLNVNMAGPLTASEVAERAAVLMAGLNGGKLRRDHVQAIEVVFQVPPSCDDPSGYLARCLEWLISSLCLPVLSAVAHYDESSPHAHVLVLPIRGGRYVGGSPIARRELKRLREDFFARVAGPAGFQRYGAKLRGEARRRGVVAVDEWCIEHGLPESCGPLWPLLRESFVRDPTDFVRALAIDLSSRLRAPSIPIGIASAHDDEGENPIGIAGRVLDSRSLSLCRDCDSDHSAGTPRPSKGSAGAADGEPQSGDTSRVFDGVERVRDELAHTVDHWAD